MGRKTVRIAIPTGYPEKYTKLLEKLWEKHVEMGAQSPLLGNSGIDMAKFEANMQEALQKREQALEYYNLAQSLMQQSRHLMGVDKGQTIEDPGTLYHMIDVAKNILLIKHRGTEELLSEWGFNVVIRQAKSPVRKKKPATGQEK